ncbi:hypothetical protein DFP72DRAFT_867537 [Ephemerocybe angulata]|uniref:HMG box domain-containing protein n=1 Tax=Ephemerocybe angulata TaxID=980116 RepID=A0A8H6IJ01_9AGAR|nr:hypothetical protein DFP72DRAFT_867537 [Tulosesus angulatus]
MPALRTRDTSRSLEVTTDAPAPPALTILSPTPKTFAFPTSHNLSGSPYSSPSHSPFEPDHNPRPQYPAHPNSLNPSTPPDPSPRTRCDPHPPTPSTHKRRKSSTCSTDSTEHRPKKGDDGYIKRPENAFILFRRKCCEDRQAAAEEAATMQDGPQKKQRQADLSKTISQQWKGLPAEDRQYWENLAKEKKKEHEQMYPNYVYRPQRSKDKDGRSKKNKSTSRKRGEEDGVKIFVPQQQSASRYQEISLPVVHHLYPQAASEDTGPLGPLLAKMPSDNLANGFDWVPSASYAPPSLATNQFNPHLVSMEYTQNLFTQPPQLRRSSLMPLSHLTPSNGPILSPLERISAPSSGSSSGSSSPASPVNGPFTPSSAALPYSFHTSMQPPNDFESLGPLDPLDPNLSTSQAELDLHAELHHQEQTQQDFSQYSWGWNGAPAMLDNNWDLSSISPAFLGEQPGAFNNNGVGNGKMNLLNQDDLCGTGLEFGSDFSQALDGGVYGGGGDPTLIGGHYDEYMSGAAFTV